MAKTARKTEAPRPNRKLFRPIIRAVLVTVTTSDRVMGSGSGVVIKTDPPNSENITIAYVLTCKHNLKALGHARNDTNDAPRLMVNGKQATDIGNSELKALDLTVLSVKDLKPEFTAQLDIHNAASKNVELEGFVDFFQGEFEWRKILTSTAAITYTVMSNGTSCRYFKLKALPRQPKLARGMSGGPVLLDDKVIAIGRILDLQKSEDGKTELCAYTTQLDASALTLIERCIPTGLPLRRGRTTDASSLKYDEDTIKRPAPREPLPSSLAADDIQKGRWGGKNKIPGYEVVVENVIRKNNYFMFDAVLKSSLEKLKGPIVFHLHDSFPRSVVTIRKPSDKEARLESIASTGTFTFGVQFLDHDRQWQELEYDLMDYKPEKLFEFDK